MGHREQMQKKAEQWQGTSVKIIQAVRYGVAALVLLGLLILLVQNLGFPEEINEMLQASVITADGQTLDISLTLRGEVTNYPFKAGKRSMGDQITVYANGTEIRILQLVPGETFFFGRKGDTVCFLSFQRDQLLLETDLQKLFPDMESGTCLVYTGDDSFELPGEVARYFTFLQK